MFHSRQNYRIDYEQIFLPDEWKQKSMNITVQHIQKSFHKNRVLADLSFSVRQGEFVSVIGSSGAGKTTLFRILNGELMADSGSVCFDQTDLLHCRTRDKKAVQKQVGTIYQDYCLVEPSTCMQNVLNAALPDMHFPAALLGLFGRDRRVKAGQLLSRVGLADKYEEPVHSLSGGQKQRCAIARALFRHPSVILADEPVSSLDPVTGTQILDLLKEIQQQENITVLMNSHNLAMALEYSDRIIGLHEGTVLYDGPADGLTPEVLKIIYNDQEEKTDSLRYSDYSVNIVHSENSDQTVHPGRFVNNHPSNDSDHPKKDGQNNYFPGREA
mgnify:CR=1 FL=1